MSGRRWREYFYSIKYSRRPNRRSLATHTPRKPIPAGVSRGVWVKRESTVLVRAQDAAWAALMQIMALVASRIIARASGVQSATKFAFHGFSGRGAEVVSEGGKVVYTHYHIEQTF